MGGGGTRMGRQRPRWCYPEPCTCLRGQLRAPPSMTWHPTIPLAPDHPKAGAVVRAAGRHAGRPGCKQGGRRAGKDGKATPSGRNKDGGVQPTASKLVDHEHMVSIAPPPPLPPPSGPRQAGAPVRLVPSSETATAGIRTTGEIQTWE